MYLEEWGLWGGPHLLVVLEEVPGLTHPTDWRPGASDDDGAALMEMVCFAAGQEDMDIVKPVL